MTRPRGRPARLREGGASSGMPSAYDPGGRSDPFQILVAEHALLRQDMERALVLVARIEPPPGMDRKLRSLVASFELHTIREDQVLMPVSERLFGGKDGAAAVMREDHAAIKEVLDSLAHAEASLARRREQIERLKRQTETHFAREEHVLFPLMSALLSNREAAVLAQRLREVSGPGG